MRGGQLDEEGLSSLFTRPLGMKLVDTLVQQIEGKINVHTNNGVWKPSYQFL